MDPISSTIPSGAANAPATNVPAAGGLGQLNTGDFFQLLIAELTNQDPFEPTDNKDLLKQISSIREIELSTTLTDSLRDLSGGQQFASASALIGKFVTGLPGGDGARAQGVVVGVRFDDAGQAVLRLADGRELPMEQVSAIEPANRAAESLIGTTVTAVDRADPANPEVVTGMAIATRLGADGELMIELDSGDEVRFSDIVDTAPLAA